MENYTKYKLKSSDELTSVLSGRDNLFVHAKIEKKVGLPKYSLILFGGFTKKS